MESPNKLSQKADRISRQINRSQIANKIYDKISNLEQDFSIAKRRWIWELIQNAKEACVKDKIKIQIVLAENYLEFSHNGKPFTTEDLVCLIEQTSKKPRLENTEEEEDLIRSGGGFSATYLLSQNIRLKGVWQNSNQAIFKRFDFYLSMNSKNRKEIMNNIDKCYEVFGKIEKTEPLSNFRPGEGFETVFRFGLDSRGKEVAKAGLVELENSGLKTLLFNKCIFSIRTHELDIDNKVSYKFDGSEDLKENEKETIRMETFSRNDNLQTFLIMDCKANPSQFQLSIELSNRNNQKHFQIVKNDQSPMIFVSMPLIGTENFPFPVTLNCPSLAINEQRNGLIMKGPSEVERNKEIFNSLKLPLQRFINYIFKYSTETAPINKKHILANTKTPKDFDEKWYKKCVQIPLRYNLARCKIVETHEEKLVEVLNCKIPSGPIEFVGSLHELLAFIMPKDLIKNQKSYISYWMNEIEGWERANEDAESNLVDDKFLIEFVEKKKSIKNLKESFAVARDDDEIINWLNKFYSYLGETYSHLEFLKVLNEKALVPDENGRFKKINELYEENCVPEGLQSILHMIGYNALSFCKDKRITISVKMKQKLTWYWASKKIENFYTDKTKSSNEKESVSFEIMNIFPEKPNKAMDILSLNPKFMNVLKAFFPNFKDKPSKMTDKIFTLWKRAENFLIGQIIQKIEDSKNLKHLAASLNKSEDFVLENILSFCTILLKSYRIKNIINAKIYLNKSKKFENAKDLVENNRDWVSKDEIKSLIEKIKVHFKNNPVSSKKSDLKKINEQEEEHKEIAQNDSHHLHLRSSLEENFNDFLFGGSKKMKERQDDEFSIGLGENPEFFNQNMINMGLTTSQQFHDLINRGAIKLKNLQNENMEAYQRSQELLEKAKKMVLEALEKNENYNIKLAYWDEEAPNQNILLAITKNGKNIHIVVRPAIGNKIMIHDQRESRELQEKRNELWVSDGKKAVLVDQKMQQTGEFKVIRRK